jgi:hypothetical protein|tara:strand:+ start:557 stop:1069 length:513 start_codon:yes stop_codon:yes gene_type:complete
MKRDSKGQFADTGKVNKKRGHTNKDEKVKIDELCKKKGFNPVSWLIEVASNEEIPWRERIRATIEINSCLHPKKKAMDVAVDQTITLVRQNFMETIDVTNIDTASIPAAYLSKAGLVSDGTGSKKASSSVAPKMRKGHHIVKRNDRPDAPKARELLPLVPNGQTGEESDI